MTSAAFADADADYERWFLCTQDSDCVILPGSACDGQISINKTYFKAYEDYDFKLAGINECTKPPPDDPNVFPKCVKNTCAMAMKGDAKPIRKK